MCKRLPLDLVNPLVVIGNPRVHRRNRRWRRLNLSRLDMSAVPQLNVHIIVRQANPKDCNCPCLQNKRYHKIIIHMQ